MRTADIERIHIEQAPCISIQNWTDMEQAVSILFSILDLKDRNAPAAEYQMLIRQGCAVRDRILNGASQ